MQRGPWFAVNLSLLFPGLGQFHLGQRLRGLVWLLGSLLGLVAIFWAYLAPGGNVQLGAGLLGMGVMLWVFNLIDAHSCAAGGWQGQKSKLESFGLFKSQPQANPPQHQSLNRSSLVKDRWFLVFLSQILPGLGQLYQGQYGLALIFFALTLMSLTLLAGQLGLILGIPALAAFAVFQLCAAAGSSRPSEGRSSEGRSEGRFLQRAGAQMALLVFVGRSLFFAAVPLSRQIVEPFSVPSESMFPTLMVGDRILVRKRHNYQPKPGDIIVFRAPSLPPDPSQLGSPGSPGQSMASAQPTRDPEEFFVKRVVGKGGDRIQVQAGQTFRNGQALTEPYINEPPQYSWDSEAIAHNRLIVLGDNRNASFDSSRWGSLPRANVVGRAYRISWPPERSRPLP